MLHNRNTPNNEIKELREEVLTWKKMVASRMEANILLKNMLSDVLKNNYHQNCLEEIEEFQTKFIQEDEKTNILKKHVADLENILNRTIDDGIRRESFEQIMKKLRNDFAHSRDQFQFYCFLLC